MYKGPGAEWNDLSSGLGRRAGVCRPENQLSFSLESGGRRKMLGLFTLSRTGWFLEHTDGAGHVLETPSGTSVGSVLASVLTAR